MKIPVFGKIVLLLCCVSFYSIAQQTNSPRLIIRTDDMGAFHSVNKAFEEIYRKGVQSSIEVMVVTPWFPEAVKMLREMPTIDVGLHLTLTSEWENIKWRPLTACPSLTDVNGYFYPMMGTHAAYPGQAVMENKWDIGEVEQEFRAQIELALKNIPQISHLSGHMGATGFDPEVVKVVKKLAAEYRLPAIDRVGAMEEYNFSYVGYDGPKNTASEKEDAFIRMLNKLEPGHNYMFIDHPAFDNDEMQTVAHIGYEDVAVDRQGVTDMLTSEKVMNVIRERGIELISYNDLTKPLPRSAPEAEKIHTKGITDFKTAIGKSNMDLHSLMILRHGKVVYEEWFGEHSSRKPHIMNSVSKTFTATAIGFAVSENLLSVSDKVISFFPDLLPETVSPYLEELTIEHLLTMTTGHDTDPTYDVWKQTEPESWERSFFEKPLLHKPGTSFVYNSLGTYMLASILQRVTGEILTDYLYPRLFRPLGIVEASWQMSPSGVNTGGWGLYIKTEDMAKMGQFILQKGNWKGDQLLPENWFEVATSAKVASLPAGIKKEDLNTENKNGDWVQGYGYQMWRCHHNAFRADGANGQFIIIIPDKDAVIVTTSHIGNMQAELDLIWKYLLPAMKD